MTSGEEIVRDIVVALIGAGCVKSAEDAERVYLSMAATLADVRQCENSAEKIRGLAQKRAE